MSKEIPTQKTEVDTKPESIESKEEIIEDGGEDTTKKDPLDSLSPEELLAEAKKFRGIASRKDSKPKEAPKPEAAGDFVTREELYAENRKEAARLVTEISGEDDPLAESKRLIDENWDDIMTYFVSRNGQAKPEHIVEDVMDAYQVWLRRNGKPADDSARTLQTTTVPKAGGTGEKPKAKSLDTDDDPRFSKGKTPDKWYPKD